jgi:hypothetical protein
MIREAVALITSGALLGCGASWPNRANALAAPQVHDVTTVDILPIDLEVWTENGYPLTPDAVRDGASYQLISTAMEALQQRRYAIDGLIDWNGQIDTRTAVMDPLDVEHTIATLARYDLRTGRSPVRLPDPQLPARLGAVTGADATLYIGGWAYVAAHHTSTGEKVAEGILIGVAIVAVVAIIAIAVAGGSKGGHGGGHGGGGHGGGGHGGGGHSAPTFHDHRVAAADHPQFASLVVHDHRTGGLLRDHRSSGSSGGGVHVSSDTHVHLGTAIDIIDALDPQTPTHPDWSGDVPANSEHSQMYVEMTLVDNTTGAVLWHAHQKFPASAASKDDMNRVVRTMLASLPAR